jgi:tRNA-dihydrouridine synthase B
MMRIGSIQIATNIFLAPLSGCSDLAFRLIARECGAQFCFFEMVDAHSLLGPKNPKKFQILQTRKEDSPIAAQMLGSDPVVVLDGAQALLEQVPVTFLDVNSACPAKKVVKRGAGAGLLARPAVLGNMLQTLASQLPVPITVKLRIGFHHLELDVLRDLAKLCEASGATALFVHGRTRAQAYTGEVDYQAIRAVKQAVNIPVVGSGNVFTPELAAHMLTETGCDGILVARGAFGSPWIFRDIQNYLQQGVCAPEEDLSVRKAVLKRHLAYIAAYKECSASGKIGFMRKVTIWYLKGFPGAARIRGLVGAIPDYESLLYFIENIM